MTGKQKIPKPMLQPRFKLWIETVNGEGAVGEGKWRRLVAISRTGSLRAAADELGISYRKAWGDLRTAERCSGVTFLERRRGGQHGGESSLTPEGESWLKASRLFRKMVERNVAEAFEAWSREIDRSSAGPSEPGKKPRT
ncbi:MAG: molybdate transport system regulatory protein [Candidatus Hydrogenedentes bacterium]|nr:molybdate transport system regulatory protein [Candidatus Hydrogenedentota bacterium]